MGLFWTLSAVLAYGAIRYGGVLETDRFVMALALGLTAAVYFASKSSHGLAPALPPWPRRLLAAVAVYGLAQLVPLPRTAVGAFSPTRAESAAAMGDGWAPLTVAPAHSWLVLASVAACVLTFLLAREAAWRLERRAWLAAVPIAAIAALEAALGLAQYYSNYPSGVAHGTWVNRNHFAGFLEMGLMLAVGMLLPEPRPSGSGHLITEPRPPGSGLLRRSASILAVALILAGIMHSLSRMGFTAALAGLGVGAMALAGRRFRLGAAAVAVAAVAGLFVYLPPDRLIGRFAELAATEEISADQRVEIWRDSARLIRAYPVFGCGLGGYEAALYQFKSAAPLNTVDYAHNDYLQAAAEMGGAGIGLCLALAAWVFRKAWGNPAAIAALAAIALHSLVDFNLYIPANAMAVAWIAGLAASDG